MSGRDGARSAFTPPDSAGVPRLVPSGPVYAVVAEALRRGDAAAARRAVAEAALDAREGDSGEWARLRDVSAWPDGWLVAAVRCDPPDVPALDALVGRYWKRLYARCELLTVNRETARDLAQESWSRVLRARRALDPDANFACYLVTVATNLWRDRYRAERRAGPLGERRLASIDASVPTSDGDGVVLADVLPDLNALSAADQALLKLDVDRALAQLTPRARDVLTARFLDGESAAEIGRRYGRTEQTITAWVRQAIGEIRTVLAESPDRARLRSSHG